MEKNTGSGPGPGPKFPFFSGPKKCVPAAPWMRLTSLFDIEVLMNENNHQLYSDFDSYNYFFLLTVLI
jgi:hypothetical protein